MTNDDQVQFFASIPGGVSAIRIDGDTHGGGKITLDVPGSDIAPLLRLTLFRGKRLKVTVEVDE